NRTTKHERACCSVAKERRNASCEPLPYVFYALLAAFDHCNDITLGHEVIDQRLKRKRHHVLVGFVPEELKAILRGVVPAEAHRCTRRTRISCPIVVARPRLKLRVFFHPSGKVVVIHNEPSRWP